MTGSMTFVIFPLGERRYALDSAEVIELSRSGNAQTFPHTTPGLLGVLVHRGEILPVWDVASTIAGTSTAARKYYLVTRRNFTGEEWTAIPVSGQCQMLQAEMQLPPDGSAMHVQGLLLLGEEQVEVLDLDRLSTLGAAAESQECNAEGQGKQR